MESTQAKLRRHTVLSADGSTLLPSSIPADDWEKWRVRLEGYVHFPVAPAQVPWDLALLLLIIYSSVSVPLRVGMNIAAAGWWIYLELLVDTFFIADTRLQFRMAYLEGDQFVVQRSKIATHYLRPPRLPGPVHTRNCDAAHTEVALSASPGGQFFADALSSVRSCCSPQRLILPSSLTFDSDFPRYGRFHLS